MRGDFIQRQLWLKYRDLKLLKQMLAEADDILDPVDRAMRRRSLGFEIRNIEQEIDELMRRA